MSAVDREHSNPELDSTLEEGEEPAPRGTRAMAGVRWAMLGGTIALAAFSWWSFARAEHSHDPSGAVQHAPRFQCPMHPQIVSDEPGECPICHMELQPIGSERAEPAGSTSAGAHLPRGTAPLTLSLDRVQSIGVRTALVEERPFDAALRVTAVIAAPDQGVAEVHVRTPGFVERIFVDQTGVAVGAGQALFALYSPELYQAQNELLTARQWTGPDAGGRTLDAAKRKLDLLGMSARDVVRVLESGEPTRAVTVYAPAGGYVTKKAVVLGSYVTPEATLYELQDLSHVYVVADVFQSDMSRVAVGTVGAFVPSTGGRPREARVDLVYPVVNAEARTTRIRMQVKNDGEKLLPGAYGTVEIAGASRRALFVPRDAVVDTGRATYVFVVEGEGRYVPTTVVLGESQGDAVSVREGVKAGDRVVSGATFLIDSESRLHAAISERSAEPDHEHGR